MKNHAIRIGVAVAAAIGLLTPLSAQTVPPRFKVTQLATGINQPKGLDSALHRAGAGPMGDFVYVAESGLDRILQIDKRTGASSVMAQTGTFPVGMACYGGPFSQYMYVGNAFSSGIQRISTDGIMTPFAVPNMSVAGLDFGKGVFGQNLYAGEWQAGNIWRVDTLGNATLFASNPGTQTRYIAFSHGGAFGNFLYYSDYANGDIYRVDPTGTVTFFTSVTTGFGLEGLEFSPGGAFGDFLYAGNLSKGEIYQIAPDGTSTVWATGFRGVADLIFKPGGAGGFSMYLVDGQFDGSVYAISLQRNKKLQ